MERNRHKRRHRKHQRRERRYIFAELPQCDACGGVDFDVDGGTVRNPDGSKCQYATCETCGAAVKIIWNFPEAIPPGGIDK